MTVPFHCVRVGLACVAVTFVISGFCGECLAQETLRAGAATANITPPLGSPIVGGWAPIPARHIHDELHVRALVLDDGQTRVGFAICDNVGIPREVFDAAKAIVQKETGISGSHLLTASTHTHSAASARGASKVHIAAELDEYQRFIVRRIGDAVRCAVNNLEPARIGWGSFDEPSEVFNRRWFMTDPEQLTNPFGGVDQVRMNPPRGVASLVRPAGPIDPQVSFLSVRSTDGRPIALLANYSLHYVGGVRSGDISADYFGMFATRIAQLLGTEGEDPPFVGILSNGTCGDVNNINFRGGSQRLEPYEKMRQVADLIAERVYEAQGSVEYRDAVSLAAASTELELAVRLPDAEMLAWARQTSAETSDDAQAHRRSRIYAERILLLEDGPETISAPLQVLRIGDVGITAIPFEVFAEIGLAIKEESPLRATFNIELANGSFGYLPTPEQHKLGGYETWLGTNFVEFKASDKIEATVLELLNRVAESN